MTITSFNPVILTKNLKKPLLFLKPSVLSAAIKKAVRQKMMIRLWLLQLFG